jgi:hypothetical protein
MTIITGEVFRFDCMGNCMGDNPNTGKCYRPVAFKIVIKRATIYLCQDCLNG